MSGPNTTRGRTGGQPNESTQPANAGGRMVVGASTAPSAPSETAEQKRQRIIDTVRKNRADMGWFGHADAFLRSAANTATFGYADKFAAGADALLGYGEGNSIAERYRFNQEVNEAVNRVDAEDRPTAQTGGEVLAENLPYERGLRVFKRGERILRRLGRGRKACKACSRRPVVLSDGTKVTFDVDFLLHGALPLDLSRAYASDLDHDGPLGRNRIGSFDETLSALPDGSLRFAMASGVTADYARPAPTIGEISVNTHHPAISLAAGPEATFTAREHGVVRLFRRFPDGVWRLAEIRDLNDNAAHLVRDEAGLLLRLDRSDGFALLFENDAAGRRTGVTLRAPGGETRPISRYAYDAQGNLVEVRNAYARSFRYAYDAAGRFAAYDDGVATRVAYAYDAQDRVVAVTTPGGAFDHTLAYEPEARATTLAYARLTGAARTVFDADGNFVAQTDGLGQTRTYERDEFGAVVAETDAEGQRTAYAYDAFGTLSAVTDPEGRRTAYQHDEDGRLERLIDPAGQAWEWTYDGRGNLVSSVDPLGHRTDYAIDAAGLPTAIMRHDGLIERRDYDAHNNLVRLVDYRGGTTLFARDAFGRLTARTDPLGHVTRFVYDERPGADFWTPTALTRPDGVTVRREAEPHEATLTLTDGEGRRTLYRYGPFDLLEAIEDPKGGSLRFSYDAEERLVRVENQLGRHWSFARDAAGRVVAETDFSGLTTRYAYDRADRVVEARHADGARVAYAYDRAGLLVREEGWTPGAATPAVTTYRYDACGRLAEAVNADATVAFARDALGRVIAETQNGRRVTSAYDCCGHRTERRIGGRLVAAAYDPLGALSGLTIGDHAPLRVTRDAAGRETLRESAAGFRLAQAWDAVGQLARQSGGRAPGAAGMPLGPGVERVYAWSRDFAPQAIRDARWGETRYETDAAGQVVRTRHGDGGEEHFSYDATLTLVGSGRDEEVLRPWQVAPGGRVERARGPQGETIQLAYDARMRVVERRVERDGFRPRTWRYGWNAQDRLVACETPSGERWAYGYDAFGRRVWKRRLLEEAEEAWVRGKFPHLVRSVAAGGRSALDVWPRRPAGASEADADPPVVGTAYLWDGDVVAEEALLRLDGSVEWERATRWHFAPGGFVPVAKEEADGRLRYVVTDHLGTPREVFEEDGGLVWAAEYRTWGCLRRSYAKPVDNLNIKSQYYYIYNSEIEININKSNSFLTDTQKYTIFKFQGQIYDKTCDLNYNRYRYYDDMTGQYLSPDILGLIGGLRTHSYVSNPIGWIDPLGLSDASSSLPQLRGKSVPHIERTLQNEGFANKNPTNPRNSRWMHPDGSEVRVHKYGNKVCCPYKSGNNAHVHKQDPNGSQLNDRGIPSSNPDETHIGIRNPKDFPSVAGRPHGS